MSYALNGLGQAKLRGATWPKAGYGSRRQPRWAGLREKRGYGYRKPTMRGWLRERGRGLKGLFGIGQDEEAPVDVERLAPSAPGATNVAMILGWGSVLALTAGIFYAATRGTGTGVRANPRRRRRRGSRRRSSRRGYRLRRNRRATKRRSTRRRRSRRSSRRRSSRRRSRRGSRRRATGRLRSYKALTAAARSRMPPSAFALPGKRFPVKGPPGSSAQRNKWQALQAIRYLNMGRVGTKKEFLAVRNAVIRKYGAGFWRRHGGPTWNKVVAAKRRRGATRRRTTPRRGTGRRRTRRSIRRGRRRVAANRRTSRRRNAKLRSRRRTSRNRSRRTSRRYG